MSPLAANETGKPRIVVFSFVFAIALRTSARVALPSAQAFVTAPTTTWAATYDGRPKNSPLPLWALMYALTTGSAGLYGKAESYDPVIFQTPGANRPSEPNSLILDLPAAFSCCPKACACGASCHGM